MSRIAIIGLGCLFPGAPDLARFWRNIVDGVDAISEVPRGRWDAQFHDPDSKAIDRFYCKRGGFVDDHADFDPLAFGVMPRAADAGEPDQLLTLRVGYEALADAGYAERPFPRSRTGVIIGRGNYIGAGVLRLQQHVRLLPQILQTLRDLFPALGDEALARIRARLTEKLDYYGPDVAAGMIPNLLASRLANRLDLHGPAYTVDAACASSLIAVEQGCASLARGETDLMLVGGAHLTHDLTFWATFCQLGALSRSGMIRPLSEDADGILAGEGVGIAVLKRLDDALADGDRVYAVIEGVGSSSDGRSASLVAPSAEGQRIALDKAWRGLPFGPEAIGLLEAHGTGTPTGDAIELDTVAAFFGGPSGQAPKPVIGSVKSMIGHAMPASGMASLIKTALAIHHGVLPPTLHCQRPHPALARTRFRTIGQRELWLAPREARVASVNAFGFGGINAHLVLRGLAPTPVERAVEDGLAPVLLLAADSQDALLARFDAGHNDPPTRPGRWRLAVIAPDAKKRATARKAIVAGKPWTGRQQIWLSPGGLLGAGGGKLAFVFPGVDSAFEPRTDGLADYFGTPLPEHCRAPEPGQPLSRQVLGLLGFNRYLHDRLLALGVIPQAYAGHSVGEWSAMLCSGMMDQALSDRTNAALDVDAVQFPDALFLSASCDEARLRERMQGLDGIALSHDNCPHQVIACGSRAAIEQLARRLREASVFAQVLPFVSGFHSPMFAPYLDWYRALFGAAELREPAIPVWSATRAAPFPADQDARRQLAIDHLVEPVRFRSLIERLHDQGFRVFIEVGTGSLSGFIDDTLSGRPHHAIRANHENRSGLAQLQQLSAALWVEGAAFDSRLLSGAPVLTDSTAAVAAARPSTRRLALGVPLLRVEPLPEALPTGLPALPEPAADDPVGRALRDAVLGIEQASRDVLRYWNQRRQALPAVAAAGGAPGRASLPRRLQRLLDLDRTIPQVRDHALYPQRPGWPILADWHPVVPMTMEVMLVREAVEETLPGAVVVEVCQIQAYNWLVVSKPLTVDIELKAGADGSIDAEIVGYFRARLRVADRYPAPDREPFAPLTQPRATAVDAEALYREHWMFHGPAYQGVRAFEAIGDDGIAGRLQVPTGSGALLDNMGQLAGYWVMEQPVNCLAMPIGVDAIRFYGPDLQPGDSAGAEVRVTELDALSCVTDHQLRDRSGRLRIAIDGWRTRRYQMDKRFWTASRDLSTQGVSQPVPGQVAVFDDRYDTAILRDYLSRRYLTASERAVYDELPPKRRRQWLAGRVAAKDAVRHWLRETRGAAAIHPQELRIVNDPRGAPQLLRHVTDAVPDGLQISIAHKGAIAAAIVGERPVGIDVERIEAREASFLALVFSDAERVPLLNGEAEDIAWTRGWVAKEAAAKAAGTGLGGRLRDFVITARDGDCLRVNGLWVVTHRLGDDIIGWTLGGTGAAGPAGVDTRIPSAQTT